jgi:butyryl-CoA dehydrogenase
MDFSPTPEQRRWRDLARDFAQGVIAPRAEQLDREQQFPYDIIAQMASLGLMGMTISTEFGGSGGDFIAYCMAMEEISRADTSVGVTMEAHTTLGCGPIAEFGTEEQKQRFLGTCLSKKQLWAFGLTEENEGTDAGGTETTAELRNGAWVINGAKKYITNSGTTITAGVTVMTRSGRRPDGRPALTAILVPQDTQGYTQGPAYEKLGWRAADQHPLYFHDCEVPEANVLGAPGSGFRQFLQALDGGRIAVGALSVGLAQACFDEAIAFARRRRQFGKQLSEFQVIQFKIADMALEIELARTLVHKAAWLRGNGKPHSREASMAKVYASETAKRAADQALQIHGGAGFLEGSAVARYWRQVKINEIGEGTSEINRQVIARSLLAETGSPQDTSARQTQPR